MRFGILLVFFLWGMSVSGTTGTENFFFTALDVKDGLPQQTVTLIFQDADGYMWFGTRNGLSRYDGYEFKTYRKNYDDSHSLSGNYITAIIQDNERNIWVATQNGLNQISHRTGEINRYWLKDSGQEDLNVKALYSCLDGQVLAFTGRKSFFYDRQQDSFRLLEFPGEKLPGNIASVTEDQKGNLYIGTYDMGIWIYNRERRLTRKIQNDARDPLSLPEGYISYLLAGSDGRLWIVAGDKYVACYLPQEDRIVRFDEINNVRHIIEWDDDYMLAGTFQGIAMIDRKTFQIRPVSMNIGSQGGLSHYSVLCLNKDRQGNLWVGTYSGGVNYYNKYNHRFSYIPALEFTGIIGMGVEDPGGKIWFATEGGGLLEYDPQTERQNNYLLHNRKVDSYNENIIKALLLEGNTILCTTHGGEVYSFSIAEKKYRLLYDFGYNDIYALCRDSEGRLWIPTNTESKMVVMDSRGQRLESLEIKNRNSVLNSPITSILELDKNHFLLGTQKNGVVKIDIQDKAIQHLSVVDFGFGGDNSIWVTAFHRDGDGDIWVATNGAGLFQFGSEMKLKKRYNKANGLVDERVYNIMERGDMLWLLTSRELFRLDRKQGLLSRFYSKEGIIPEEFSISGGVTSSEGKMYLPGAKGFLLVNPALLNMNPEKPPVYLTELKINNEIVRPGTAGSPLRQELHLESKLILRHNQTNLIIGYTGLNYLYPEQNQYAYRMNGVDEDWNYVGSRREAFYSNLSPGEYVFSVMASNNDGVWNDHPAEIHIVVLNPLWFRWWALLIYVSVVMFVIYKIIMARHRKHELERSLHIQRLEQEKQEELNQERIRFFTHVTHEFRTPLTLILNPLEELLQKYVHIAGVKDSLLLIRRNARRLLSLVNSLMDIEKQQAGKVALVYSDFDFSVFIREIILSFQSIAASRKICFDMKVVPESIRVHYDREKLEQVLFNLLSNAFKFTPAGGSVVISAGLYDEKEARELAGDRILPEGYSRWFYIAVSDDGVGVDPKYMDKIFEPFYQAGEDLHGEIAGSGIGLSLSKSIVEQHHGIIYAACLHPGTLMSVWLPYTEVAVAIPESYVVDDDTEIPEIANSRKHVAEGEEFPTFRSDYKLLLVEDNEEVLDYLSKQMTSEYAILTAGNGRIALDIAEREFPDMIISDVMMPEMDGIELCSRIKKDIRLCHIPVILLTAKSMTIHIEEGFSVGADDYIAKPFSISLLKIRIKNIFRNREQMKEIFGKKFSLESLGIEVESVDQTFMDRYVEIVKRNFTNSNLDVDMICQELGMSRANFYKKLKIITDLSPAEMIRNIRLESAARLLRETKLTVSEIAAQVGFSSNSYFGSCFKTLYGMSPKEFQNVKE